MEFVSYVVAKSLVLLKFVGGFYVGTRNSSGICLGNLINLDSAQK